MSEHELRLPPLRPATVWGDCEPPWVPDTVGSRGRTAEAPWKPGPDPDHPDTVFERGRIGDVSVMAAAARGAKHRFEGALRQDSALACSAAGEWALAAVADGVGSVPGSHLASEAAVRLCLAELSVRLERSGADAFRQGPALFKHVAVELLKLKGPRTTLTVGAVAAAPDADGYHHFWTARVGDSPAYVLGSGNPIPQFVSEREDEYGTATAAMPTMDLRGSLREKRGRLGRGRALMLVSDGIGDLIATDENRAARNGGPIESDVREYFGGHWRKEPAQLDFLRQIQVRRKSFDDDRSAAVLWVSPESEPGEATPLRPGSAFGVGRPLARDLELHAGRLGPLEIRAAASNSRSGPRRTRVVVDAHADRLVAIAVAPAGPDAGPTVERWTGSLRTMIDRMPTDYRAEDWMPIVWTHALRSLNDDPEFQPGAASSALLCVEPTAEAVHYTLGISAGLSAAIAGAGIHRELAELREPEVIYEGTASEPSMRLYSDRLEENQTLLLTHAIDPALIAKDHLRPGPLQTLDLLRNGSRDDDPFAVVLWGER